MKKILFFLLGVSAVMLAVSCSDNDKYGARPKVTFKAIAADGSGWVDVATVYVGKDGRIAAKDEPVVSYNSADNKIPEIDSVKLPADIKIGEDIYGDKGKSATLKSGSYDSSLLGNKVTWVLDKDNTEVNFTTQKFTENTTLYAKYDFEIKVNFHYLTRAGVWRKIEGVLNSDSRLDSVPSMVSNSPFPATVAINNIVGTIKLGENDYKGVANNADNADAIDKTVDAGDVLTVFEKDSFIVWVGADNKVVEEIDIEYNESKDLYALYKVEQK